MRAKAVPTHNVRMSTILVVDDEPIVRDVVVRYLRRDGFATLEAGTGEEALTVLERETPALVVLDVMLLGADDYVTKPFSPRELSVRVRNLLRRASPVRADGSGTIRFGAVEVDGAAREVRRDGEPLKLTL